jgi:hypothetical protein
MARDPEWHEVMLNAIFVYLSQPMKSMCPTTSVREHGEDQMNPRSCYSISILWENVSLLTEV